MTGYKYEVHVEGTPVLLHDTATFGELRDLSDGPEGAPVTYLAPRGVTEHFDDDDVVVEEIESPLPGKIVFREPPYDEWRDRRWPGSDE